MSQLDRTIRSEDLASCFLFRNLTPEQRRTFAPRLERRALSRSTLVFAQGGDADGFYWLESGSVQVYRSTEQGQEATLHVIRPGDVFGEAAMFLQFAFPASAVTLERSTVWFIPRKAFFDALSDDPEFARRVLAGFAMKLREFTERFESLTGDTLERRLSKWIIDEFGDNGVLRENKPYTLPLSKKGLAAHLGATPEALSRALRALCDAGILAVDAAAVTILDAGQLRERAGF